VFIFNLYINTRTFFLIYTHVYIFIHISIQRSFFIISMQLRLAFKKERNTLTRPYAQGILLEHLTSLVIYI